MTVTFTHVKEQVKERADLAEIVGRHTKLVKSSRGMFKACCPLPGHKEKTPSFNINPSMGTFYCFGCGRGGDVFTFLELMEGLPFMDALKELAGNYGIEMPRLQPRSPEQAQAEVQAKTLRERGYDILERAAKYFHAVLVDEATPSTKKAADYLFSRGITETEIRELRLGFAPELGQALTKKITNKEDFEAALALGLIGTSEDQHRHYDFFRDRMMIPILDVRGRVVGFSGRVLDPLSKTNKYMNSRESEWFKKKAIVYGLDRAVPLIRDNNFVCIVEGYFDQWALKRAEIPAVAVMGTALTEEHLALLGRFTKNLILVLDADAAGIASTKKSLPLIMQGDWDVRVFSGFEGKDPDEWLSQNKVSSEDLRQKLKSAPDGLEWLAKNTVREATDQKLNRLQIFTKLQEIWGYARSEARKNLLADELAPLLGLDRKMVRESLDDLLRKNQQNKPRERNPQGDPRGEDVGQEIRTKRRPASSGTNLDRATEETLVWWLWNWEQLSPQTSEQWAKMLELFNNTLVYEWVLQLQTDFGSTNQKPPLTAVTASLGHSEWKESGPLYRWLLKGLVPPETLKEGSPEAIQTSFEEFGSVLLREKVKNEINLLKGQLRDTSSDAAATERILQRVQDLRFRLEKSK
jgi:DNA primase